MSARRFEVRDGGKTAIHNLVKIAGAIFVTGLLITARGGAAAPTVSASGLDLRVFGVNMGLFDSNEQLLHNVATQQRVAAWHTQTIRIPTRSTVSDSTELLALQTIKTVGATAMINVHGAVDSSALADDTHLLGLVAQVFGSSLVYVEYGNEEDLSGINDVAYTNSWNAVVPSLKAAHPTYKFMGPVNFEKNPAYIGYFVGHAVPAPDIVSWHEYVCGPSDATSICLTHIANWAEHVTNTNNAEIAAAGHTFPFMITEWNMDPLNDPRYLDPNVIQPFTTQALQELSSLVPSGLVGAQQYCVDNHGGGFELIDSNNALTPQGQAFQAALTGAKLPAPGPPPPVPSPTPLPLSASAAASPSAVDASALVSFTGTPSGGTGPYTYDWSYGDGESAASQNPKHTYLSAGTYSATLTVSDSKGASIQTTTKVTVYSGLTVVPTVTVSKGHKPPEVSFTAAVNGGIAPYKFAWEYGDGSSASVQSANHSYGVGTFQAKLTVSDAGGGAWSGAAATVSSTQAGVVTVKLAAAARTPTAAPSKGLAAAVKAMGAAGGVALVGAVLWAGLAAFALMAFRRLE